MEHHLEASTIVLFFDEYIFEDLSVLVSPCCFTPMRGEWNQGVDSLFCKLPVKDVFLDRHAEMKSLFFLRIRSLGWFMDEKSGEGQHVTFIMNCDQISVIKHKRCAQFIR